MTTTSRHVAMYSRELDTAWVWSASTALKTWHTTRRGLRPKSWASRSRRGVKPMAVWSSTRGRARLPVSTRYQS